MVPYAGHLEQRDINLGVFPVTQAGVIHRCGLVGGSEVSETRKSRDQELVCVRCSLVSAFH